MKRLLLFCLIVFTLVGCTKENTVVEYEPVSENEFLLGTVVTITLYDNAKDEIFDEIFTTIKGIEERMTINNAVSSEVILINQQAGKDYVNVSKDTFEVIKRGLYFCELSNGKFDITIGELAKLWQIGFDDARVPSNEEIQTAISHIDYHQVLLDEETTSVKLAESHMQLDLGGIAKGYAADAAVEILKKHEIKHAIINLGGNVYAYGDKPNGSEWRIGIQNPFSPRGESLGIATVKNKTVVTSGIYERNFEENGVFYHHILDPETGYPVENNIESVSIITNSSMDADALSTTIFSLGVEKGLELVNSLDDTEAIFITKDYEVYVTENAKDYFEITNSEFKLMN
ncbi:MAG TPA: thiamine biosynthesis protein ApbE [Firmicutes bacterium]|nr:thiamine biosynthesis protein ApbE [Bacillota bacterium]